jgi:hypothetical protein
MFVMNKRKTAYIAVALIAILVSAVVFFITTEGLHSLVVSHGKNFKVYNITKDGQLEYRYEITDNSGRIVKTETVLRVSPDIFYLDDETILCIKTGAGAGLFFTQYYDTNLSMFSKIYTSPILAQHGMVVYMQSSEQTLQLVVRDIFDKTEYYKEFELDFSPTANPADSLLRAEFLDDHTLEVSYLSGKDCHTQTATLNLNSSEAIYADYLSDADIALLKQPSFTMNEIELILGELTDVKDIASGRIIYSTHSEKYGEVTIALEGDEIISCFVSEHNGEAFDLFVRDRVCTPPASK